MPPIRPEPERERQARIRADLAKIQAAVNEGRLPREAITRYVERERITPEMEAAREPLGAEDTIRGALANAGEGIGFSFADELMGGLRGIVDPRISMSEGIDQVRAERDRFAAAHPKTALGLNLGGAVLPAILTAGASTTASGAGAAPTLAQSAARVAASGAGGGALAGYGSGEGGMFSGERLARAAVGGTVGGAVGAALPWSVKAFQEIGAGGGQVSTTLLDALAEQGVVPAAQAVAGQMPNLAPNGYSTQALARVGDAIGDRTQARSILDVLEQAGVGSDAMAADLGVGAQRGLRAAANLSPAGEQVARTRLGQRVAEVGQRVRSALTTATGLTPEATQSGIDDLVATRAANARPLYAAAMAEGRGAEMTPQVRAVLDEPIMQRAMARLRTLDAFRDIPDESPEMLDALYKVLSDRHATIKAAQLVDPENLGRFQQADLESLKGRFLDALGATGVVDVPVPPMQVAQSPAPSLRDAIEAHRTRLGQSVTRREGTVMQQTAREALERRSAEAAVPAAVTGTPAPRAVQREIRPMMPSYGKAVTQFADDSRLRDAYALGTEMFNKPVGDVRAAMGKMTPDEVELFKRGAFDAIVEGRVSPASPNPRLGEAARQSKAAGQVTVNTDATAERIRAIFGDDALRQLEGAARAEGVFSRTADEALRNSTTAKQIADMGIFGELSGEIPNPTNPGWWARNVGKGITAAGRVANRAAEAGNPVARAIVPPTNRETAALLTTKGAGEIRSLLDLLDALGIEDAARTTAVRPVAGTAARTMAPATVGERRP